MIPFYDKDKKASIFAEIVEESIAAMELTPDNNFLYITAGKGTLYLFSIIEKKIVKKITKIHEHIITSMLITKNNEFLFILSWNGHLKQVSIKYHCVIVDYGEVHSTCRTMCFSTDHKY